MSGVYGLADLMTEIICDRNERLEEIYLEVGAVVHDVLDEDWDRVFGPWLDSVQERVEAELIP